MRIGFSAFTPLPASPPPCLPVDADVRIPLFPRDNLNTARSSSMNAGTSPATFRMIVVCLVPWILYFT